MTDNNKIGTILYTAVKSIKEYELVSHLKFADAEYPIDVIRNVDAFYQLYKFHNSTVEDVLETITQEPLDNAYTIEDAGEPSFLAPKYYNVPRIDVPLKLLLTGLITVDAIRKQLVTKYGITAFETMPLGELIHYIEVKQ